MGREAARTVDQQVRRVVEAKGRARLIMACAPSQDEMLATLVKRVRAKPEPWRKVQVFHMDEYVGLAGDHPQSFRRYLREHFLDHVEVEGFEPIAGEAAAPEAEAKRYGALLRAAPIDVITLGIGENGHLAFNDPPVANFDDPVPVKVVDLDERCRRQQVNDGCFGTIDDVPRKALTITLPVFGNARILIGTIPNRRKAPAVRDALTGTIRAACPATLLRTHPRAFIYLDPDSAELLPAHRIEDVQPSD